jgi:protein-tyrosine phosphatase
LIFFEKEKTIEPFYLRRMEKIGVLFVCLGNICRSPMAEGLFIDLVEKAGLRDRFKIDSAGTSGHHDGELADRRMRATASGHGIHLASVSRKLKRSDLSQFDYVVAMDNSNFRDIQSIQQPGVTYSAKVLKMREFDPQPDSIDVPDPYYGGADGFEDVFQILLRCNQTFLKHLRDSHGL